MEHLPIIGITLDMVGTIFIAYMAIVVHLRVSRDKRIDGPVISEMRWEMRIGLLGILFIVAGYAMQLVAYLF